MRQGTGDTAGQLAAELDGIGDDEPRCGYSHDDHVHLVDDGDNGALRHRLICRRRADHAGAAVVVDMHVGAMPDGTLATFDDRD